MLGSRSSTRTDGRSVEALEDRAERIRMIRDSAGAIVPAGDLKRVRALRYREPGFDRAVWREMCELGWLGLRVAEAAGGSGLGMRRILRAGGGMRRGPRAGAADRLLDGGRACSAAAAPSSIA